MAPLVATQDPDLTDSEEEKIEKKTSEESVKNTNEEIIISTSTADASEHVSSKVSDTSIVEVDCKSDENSVAETSAVDASQVKHLHPWEGEPAKEPVYPPVHKQYFVFKYSSECYVFQKECLELHLEVKKMKLKEMMSLLNPIQVKMLMKLAW